MGGPSSTSGKDQGDLVVAQLRSKLPNELARAGSAEPEGIRKEASLGIDGTKPFFKARRQIKRGLLTINPIITG
ncbi:Hypothetical predicted protein [Olea europaea subsp. europaea]|uniref:Uncharacterized protein n=1 Tax=Olea europaea subsp. europaea TaxID=158383 RepID=A0A8S0QLA9_OLEEU|nr:Hypothetical predicted protein [Olea europaea subsp. europaea]